MKSKLMLTLLALVPLFVLVSAAHAAVTPVSWWRMGENDGLISAGVASSTTDPFGGRTMTLVGSPFYDPGVSSTAATRVGSTWCMWFFTGTYGTNALIPSLTNNFGIELWVNPSDTTGTKCLAYNGNSSTSGWGLYQVNNQYRGLFGGITFVGTATATAGAWTHLALVRDNGTTTLYVNGVASGTATNTPNSPTERFGVASNSHDPTLEHFAGYIDEIRAFTFTAGTFSTNDLLLYPYAKNCYWAKAAGGTYNTGANWLYALPPDVADDAYFTNATSYQVDWNASDSIANAIFNAASGSVTQAIGSYTWQMTNSCIVGRDAGAAPAVTLASGTLRATNAAGTGLYEVRHGLGRFNGGLLDVDWFRATNASGAFEFNGGTLLCDHGVASNGGPFVVGVNAAAAPAVLSPHGSGVAFNTGGLLILGSNAPNSRLYLTNGNTLQTYGGAQVGLNSGSSSNVATLSSGGTTWAIYNPFYLGYAGPRNQLLLTSGAAVNCTTAYIGYTPTSKTNLVSVSGGALFVASGSLYLGYQGSGNQMLLTNGGIASITGDMVIGVDYVATNNLLVVNGAGSALYLIGGLTLGTAGSNNSVLIQNSATATIGDYLLVGNITGSLTNYLSVAGGDLQVANQVEARYGRIQMDGGTLSASSLLLANPSGYFNLNAGTLTTSGTTVNNSRPFTVGDGASAAAFVLNGNSVHTFANGLVVSSNATLQGSGTLGGTLTLGPGATLSPSNTLASASPFGKIICSNSPSLQGILALDIGTNGVTLTNDLVQLLSGTLTYGGSLVVTKANGTLAVGNKFKLFSAPAYAGAFSSVTLPPLGAGLGWNNTLAVDGSIQVVTATAPTAVTTPATAVVPTGATLNGTVDPGALTTATWFEWGTTTNYGNFSVTNTLPGPSGISVVSTPLAGLTPGVDYNFRLAASNALGFSYGTNLSFTAPIFTNVPIPGLPGVSGGSVAWGDYDNDGRLDFLITGFDTAPRAQLWRNTGSGFTNVPIPGLPGISYASIAWGDYDNDGRLDLLLTGTTNNNYLGAISQIWRNTGTGFSNVTASVAPGLPRLYYGCVTWADFDNDGRLDFLISGVDQTGAHTLTQIWRNTGAGFTNVPVPNLPALGFSSAAWADFDNDGLLDFLITGYDAAGVSHSQLWRNTGNGFTNVTAVVAPGLPQVFRGSVAWGDYDNDGRLDFLLTGETLSGQISQLWRNTGNGFTNVPIPSLPGVHLSPGAVAWGDYDSDGLLDFLISGLQDFTQGSARTQLWRNTGNGFTNVPIPGVPALGSSVVAWGDFDNDGRLDFLIVGSDGTNGVSQLWRNYTPLANTPPTAPTGLALSAIPGGALLSWNASAGMSYNVRAGSTPGGSDLLSGQVNVTNGFRRVPAMGNAMLRGNLPLLGVTNGQTVYWSVQAVNNSFTGGPFASETNFYSSIVTTTADSGAGSLRQAAANPAPTQLIGFDPALAAQTITLTSGEVVLSNTVTVDASPLPGGITVSGNWSSRVFEIATNSTATLNSLAIRDGSFAGNGGGILNNGSLALAQCTLAGNASTGSGGGIYNPGGALMLNSCSLVGNIAGFGQSQNSSGNGGAIASPGGSLALSQCTLAGNSAKTAKSANGNGGGISASVGATLSLEQCTLSGNSAANKGGGIDNNGGTLTLNNSIVAGNTQGTNGDINGTFSGQNNLTNGSPLLAPLGDYGGPTQTMPPLPGSPAIDGCTNGTSFATDQRGFVRVIGAFADIGAVEGVFNPAFSLSSPVRLGSGAFQFTFNNLSGPSYSVYASTNVDSPFGTWSNLGAPTESPAGVFSFTDLQATNYPQRFYRVTAP